jgi:hypothetical protein
MNLTVNIPDEEIPALKTQASGLPLETFVEQVVLERIHREDVQAPEPSAAATPGRRHISDVIRERMSKIPPEIMATMPTDGASQHDHYIYGLPKRDV